MKDYKFDLGEKVTDKVTKFSGVVVSRCDHISGCNTYGLQPETLKDGYPQDVKWFDEPRLVTTSEHMPVVDARVRRTGADTVPQTTRTSPRR